MIPGAIQEHMNTVEYLKSQRDRIQALANSHISLLNWMIDDLQTSEAQAPAVTPPPATPADRDGAQTGSVEPKTTAALRSSGKPAAARRATTAPATASTIQHQVVKAIAKLDGEFATRDIACQFEKEQYKGVTSAFQALKRAGEIASVSFGRWRKTPKFITPEKVAVDYAKFRAELGDLKPAENQVSAGPAGRGE